MMVEKTAILFKSECHKCNDLFELYERTPKTNRDYWLMTEIFVFLHGSDVCDGKKKEK